MSALQVLFSDNHLLAVAKPAGVPTVPDASGDESLLERAKGWVKRERAKPGEVYLGVVHRLDRPVSGVVLFARTSKAARRLAEQFRAGVPAKVYWGVSERAPEPERGELEQWLVKRTEPTRSAAAAEDTPGAKRASTAWKVLRRERSGGRELVLVELRPRTGRPHQLRVAMATLGAPLLGDVKYGAAAPLPDASIALHARSLVIEHPIRRELLEITCAPPPGEPWTTVR